jgi:predicted nucleotidyltransferase
MKRDAILDKLREQLPLLRRMGVRALSVFGSVARDEASETSDVDVLVDFEQPLQFDRYMDVKLYLEDLLGRPVDLLTRGAAKPSLLQRIEREQIHVA